MKKEIKKILLLVETIFTPKAKDSFKVLEIILENSMKSKDKQWEDKIRLYFSKVSGSEYEERQMLKKFREITEV